MKFCLYFFFAVLFFQQTEAQKTKENISNNWFFVADSLSIYEDPSRLLSFEEVKNKKFTFSFGQKPNKQSKYWYLFYLKHELLADSVAFRFGNMDDITLFIPTKEGEYKSYKTGLLTKTASKIEWRQQKYVLKVPSSIIDQSKPIYYSTVFITTLNNGNLKRIPWFMHSSEPKALKQSYYKLAVVKNEYLFYLGVTVMSLCFFLIGFIVNKNKSFLIYGIYIFTLVAYYTNRLPMVLDFWNTSQPAMHYYINQFLRLSHMPCYYFFLYVFLNVKQKSTNIALLIKYSIYAMIGFALIYTCLIIYFPFFSLRFVLIDWFFPITMVNSLIIFFLLLVKKTTLVEKITLIGSIFLIFGGVIAIFFTDALFLLKMVLIETIVLFGVISYQNRLNEISGIQSIISLNREKQEKQSLKDLNSLKSRFFENISHEFKTPLTLIKAPLEDALSNKEALTLEDLKLLKNNTNRLNRLIEDLLSLSKLESGTWRLHTTLNNPIKQIKDMVAQYLSYAQSKEINLKIKLQKKQILAKYDTDIIEKVVSNLLSNALKFTNSGGEIILRVTTEESKLLISIIDNGIGISENLKSKIFDRFYQVADKDETRPGSGIGLALVKELVDLHKGQITFESVVDQGSSFMVEIPLLDIQIDTSPVQEDIKAAEKIIEPTLSSLKTEPQNNLPLLLIVEDNKELRAFLKSRLQKQYKVRVAEDGKIGIAYALKYKPDLIISDIMMPNIDGITLCKTLKQHVKTLAIPIILLTAKASEKDELIGIGTGADAYITKPFNLEKLKLTLNQLLLSRKNLIKRYAGKTLFTPEAENLVSADQDFLEKIRQILERRLIEPGFNITLLSKEMGMSRVQLHRRIKETIGDTPTNFLRNERLELSLLLLKNPKLSIKEVAYASGFSSPSYFIKCFKDKYKKTPSEHTANT